jgi:phenylacetate-CoA ligase
MSKGLRIQDIVSKWIGYPLFFTFYEWDRILGMKYYLQKRQYNNMSHSAIKQLQFTNLKRLLIHCYKTVPYYNKVFKEVGFNPDSIKDINDLKRLPILTKDIIRENFNTLISTKVSSKEIFLNSSGGSTGHPLNFYQDRRFKRHSVASFFLCDSMQGWSFGVRTARLWGAPKDISHIKGLKGRVKMYFKNEKFFDAFDMAPDNIRKYHVKLSVFRPDVIIAYASSAYIFAKFLKENQMKPDYPKKSIITTAEVLYDHMRKTIEEVFGVEVFDRYGSREVGNIAAECSHHRGLHINMYDYVVECLEPMTGMNAKEGEIGDLIITCFTNYAMPFVRYKIGDMGIVDKDLCTCGRNTTLLKRLIGRTSDNIISKSGRLIHGEYFTHIFYGMTGVKQFQFIQDTLNKYKLLIIKDDEFIDGNIKIIEKEIYDVLGRNIELEIKFVSKIPVEISGKYRFTISKVPVVASEVYNA